MTLEIILLVVLVKIKNVIIKGLFANTRDDYNLFSVSDLKPSINIIQAVLDAQGKPPMIIS